jgi:hypothetical protein
MMKTIEIIVAPDGRTTVLTKGFAGGTCRDASKFIEETLGSRIAENLTTEFYQQHEAEQQAEQRR